MRLVSEQANRIIADNPNTPANFGLIFNKWLDFQDNRGVWEPKVKQNKEPLLAEFKRSAAQVNDILRNRHLGQAEYCAAMVENGWRSFIFEAELVAPFVSGLGMSHPTETGMVLDHTSGAPYIPAAGQKGVMRLAHIVNSLLDDDGNWRDKAELIDQEVIRQKGQDDYTWQEDPASRTLFGFSEGTKSLAGQMVILDAYPLKAPELGEEILNPHFPDYYKGNRGPTEDQSPIPIRFLVVKPGARFVFRVLLRPPLAAAPLDDQEALAAVVEKNIRRAIEEEGLGAKTALGFGRFKIAGAGESGKVLEWLEEEEKKRAAQDPTVQRQMKFDAFVQGLPKPADLPSRIGNILEQVKGFEDDSLCRDCLIEINKRYKDQIKKAKKKKKAWVVKLTSMITDKTPCPD